MVIDYDKTKDEATKVVTEESVFFSSFPDEGEYVLRFVLPSHGWAKPGGYEVAWKIFRHHWIATPNGRKTLICSKSHDEDAYCWLCDKAQELMASGDKVQVKAGQDMESKAVMFGNVVLYATPARKYGDNGEVKIFQSDKKTVIQAIQRMFDNERTMFIAEPTATFTHPSSGKQSNGGVRVIIEKVKTGTRATDVKYELKTDLGCTDLILPNGDPFTQEGWDNQSFDLDQCTKALSPEEMQSIFKGDMDKPRVLGPGVAEEVVFETDSEIANRVK